MSENIESIGKVEDIASQKSGSGKIKSRDKELTEIEQNQTRKDFLANEFRPFRMKIDKTNGIFEIAERGFNTPAESINAIKHMGRKFSRIKICDQIF